MSSREKDDVHRAGRSRSAAGTEAGHLGDLWAPPEESREASADGSRRVRAHAGAAVAVLLHTVAETQRQAGHADLLRELVDGSAGHRRGSSNLPDRDEERWTARHDRLDQVAHQAGG